MISAGGAVYPEPSPPSRAESPTRLPLKSQHELLYGGLQGFTTRSSSCHKGGEPQLKGTTGPLSEQEDIEELLPRRAALMRKKTNRTAEHPASDGSGLEDSVEEVEEMLAKRPIKQYRFPPSPS